MKNVKEVLSSVGDRVMFSPIGVVCGWIYCAYQIFIKGNEDPLNEKCKDE